jgi:hypothetical protein
MASISYPFLRNAPEDLRWLTYFKGLVAADTHPRDQMVTAIDAIRRARVNPTAKDQTNRSRAKRRGPAKTDAISDADALAAIEEALSIAYSHGWKSAGDAR